MSEGPDQLVLAPELRMLLWAACPDQGRGLSLEISVAGLNWPVLLRLAQRHGLIYMLARRLESAPELSIPENIAQELSAQAEAQVRRCLSQSVMTTLLLERLDRQGIVARLFKGPALAFQAYGNPVARSFNDIDLLVRPEQFPDTIYCLKQAGFESEVPLTPKVIRYFQHSRRDLVLAKGLLAIDLHQQFFRGPGFFHLTTLQWQDAENISLHDFVVSTPGPALLLPVLCAHAAYHGWQRLRDLADVAWLAVNLPPEQWLRAVSYARAMKIMSLFRSGLLLLQRFFNLDIHLPAALDVPDRRAVAWTEFFANALVLEGPELSEWDVFFGFCRRLDTPLARLRYFCYFLFAPRPIHLQGDHPLRGVFFLGRLLHPFRLLRDYYRHGRHPER